MRAYSYVVLCFDEAFRGLWFYRRIVAPSILVMLVSLSVLGAFLLVSENLNHVLDTWRERGQMQVFLRDGAGEPQRRAIEAQLRASPAVEEFHYLDADAAAALFRTDFAELGEMLALLEENPLPSSYALTIRAAMRSERVLDTLSHDLAGNEAVEAVQYDLQIIRRLQLGVRAIRFIGLLLGGTVLVAALLSTANVVRVLVVSRGREIETMRLVGVPEAVVVGRFLIEGAMQGVIAGLLALGGLFVAYSLGVAYVDRGALGFLSGLRLSFLPPAVLGALIAGGALTGLVGSWLAFGPGGLKSSR